MKTKQFIARAVGAFALTSTVLGYTSTVQAVPPPPIGLAYVGIQGANGWVTGETEIDEENTWGGFGGGSDGTSWVAASCGQRGSSDSTGLAWTQIMNRSTPANFTYYAQCLAAGETSPDSQTVDGMSAASTSKISGILSPSTQSGSAHSAPNGDDDFYNKDSMWQLLSTGVYTTQVTLTVTLRASASWSAQKP
jgi:hypothetical protein